MLGRRSEGEVKQQHAAANDRQLAAEERIEEARRHRARVVLASVVLMLMRDRARLPSTNSNHARQLGFSFFVIWSWTAGFVRGGAIS